MWTFCHNIFQLLHIANLIDIKFFLRKIIQRMKLLMSVSVSEEREIKDVHSQVFLFLFILYPIIKVGVDAIMFISTL